MNHALIFDLDGTLVDTAPDLLGALNAVLHREGRSTMGMGDLRHLVGHGARAMLAEAFLRTGAPLDRARADSLMDDYIAHYRAHLADESRPFPGVEATLARLAQEGVPMGVLTNKPQELAVPLLDMLGLSRFFAAIHGAGRFSYVKPDARVFHAVVAETGGSGRAVMIGDSVTDVATARAAQAPVILLSYGYTPEPADMLGADAVTGDFTQLPQLVATLLRDRRGTP
ncbi:MAG TPA: HAD-IA family hydrolase [Rhizomicrobium sp.]|jgi:phosphoglycolate phosphatase